MMMTTMAPEGWTLPPATVAAWGVDATLDTQPRLIRGATAAPELVQLLGVWQPELHPAAADVEPKIDGHRALFLGGAERTILSREGSTMGCAFHCIDALRRLEERFGREMVFDAEFVMPGGLRDTLRAFRRNRPAVEGVMWVFDALPLDEWRRGRSTAVLAERKADLARVWPSMGLCGSVGRLLSFPMDAGATQALARGFWRRGFEGVVVKDTTSIYQRGRSNAWLKLKQGE